MSKFITDELVSKLVAKKGFGEDVDYEHMYKKVCDYYDVEFHDNWSRNNYDFYAYTETTSDGYELWIATDNPDHISINEDVHYYDSDLAGCIEDAIKDGGTIYVDDIDSDYVREAIEETYIYLCDRIEEEVIDELKDEGYEYEDTEAVA